MEAKKYLEQYEKIDTMIVNKTIEAEKWDALAQSITAPIGDERVQSSGSQQKMADAINKSIDMKSEIEALVRKKKEITNTIEQIPMLEYDILHRVYIQGKTLKEVQAEMKRQYTWITTVHGRALQYVQEILDKREQETV